MLSISARFRPMRSAIKPNSTPPIPEASRVSRIEQAGGGLAHAQVAHDVGQHQRVEHGIKGVEHPAQAAATKVRRWPGVIWESTEVTLVAIKAGL